MSVRSVPPASRQPARRSLRLVTWDYTTGSVFLTLCAATRDPVFGWITGGAFLPSPLGRLVRECWLSLPVLHSQCALDAFALMPDHLHALVHFSPPHRHGGVGPRASSGARGGLGTVINQFKRAVTIHARQEDLAFPDPLWQRGYFERIIRNEKMLATVREYIVHNALKEALQDGGRPERPPLRGVPPEVGLDVELVHRRGQ